MVLSGWKPASQPADDDTQFEANYRRLINEHYRLPLAGVRGRSVRSLSRNQKFGPTPRSPDVNCNELPSLTIPISFPLFSTSLIPLSRFPFYFCFSFSFFLSFSFSVPVLLFFLSFSSATSHVIAAILRREIYGEEGRGEGGENPVRIDGFRAPISRISSAISIWQINVENLPVSKLFFLPLVGLNYGLLYLRWSDRQGIREHDDDEEILFKNLFLNI